MVHAQYEVRVSGRLSERARGAFCAMDVRDVPTQTIIFGELAEPSDLRDLLALCSAMGLQVVSLQRLPTDRRSPDVHEAPETHEATLAVPRSTDTTRAARPR